MKIFGVAGYSGSGKTTLIEKLIPRFTAKGLRVSLIKHAHHTFDVDQQGKDSWRHRHAGATGHLRCRAMRGIAHERQAVGHIAFTAERAVELAASGMKVILVRKETNPDDLAGMVASVGILTSRGGKTSHAAVVARGMGKTAVCGADEMQVDAQTRTAKFTNGRTLNEGDVISIDGTTGEVFAGEIAVTASAVTQYFNGELAPQEIMADPLVRAVDHLIFHADSVRRMRVRANADTAEDAARARRMGAEGIGLARTEHMFLGARRELVERLIL